MPQLKALPRAFVRCTGSAYKKTVAAFIAGYEGEDKLLQHRVGLVPKRVLGPLPSMESSDLDYQLAELRRCVYARRQGGLHRNIGT